MAVAIWLTSTGYSFAGPPVPVGECNNPPSFYAGKYKLAEDIEFSGGFAFLRSIRDLAGAQSDENLRKGATFKIEAVDAFVDRLQSKLSASAGEPIHISFVQVYLDRCDAPNEPRQELHLSVRVFDSSLALPTFRRFESRQMQSLDPARASHSGVANRHFQFAPRAGFNSSDRLFGGGQMSATFGQGLLSRITAEGTGSANGSRLSLDTAGERTWDAGFLQSASWHFGFLRTDLPTDGSGLRLSSLYSQIRLDSRPLGSSSTILRFASELAGGNAQSDMLQTDVPANTVASSANQTFKSAVGIGTAAGPNLFAASYGIHLGRVGRNNVVDYYKQFVDAAYSTHKLVGDHKLLEYETRFNAGYLRTPGVVPASERFFGGNRETGLFAGAEFTNDWRIRSNPYLRGYPANRFDRVAPGLATGGESFVSWNNTVTLPMPFVNYPLLPQQLLGSEDFQRALNKQRSANESALVVSYTADEPASKEAANRIPIVKATLDKARALADALAAEGGERQAKAKACSTGIRDRLATLSQAAESMQIVVDPDDESAVIPPVVACLTELGAGGSDSRFAAAIAELKSEADTIDALLKKVDTNRVMRLVKRDMGLTDRVMNVFFKETSIVAIRPVAIFDVGRLGGNFPSTGRFGVRYSVGGGLRFQFMRVLNLTGGYAANPRRRPGEPAGAVFFFLDFLDLLR